MKYAGIVHCQKTEIVCVCRTVAKVDWKKVRAFGVFYIIVFDAIERKKDFGFSQIFCSDPLKNGHQVNVVAATPC